MANSSQNYALTYRPDIDGLRAIAVVAVIIFHAFPSILKGGFVGVDIFFVISGFLISSIIFTSLTNGHFSFTEFYTRRIRRIFPTLILVLTSSLIAGWIFLLNSEYVTLGKHIVGGATYLSNFILWFESNYFAIESKMKPLLHLWSLGIEEQFYIVWPLLLWIFFKRKLNIFTLIFLLLLTSFAWSIYQYKTVDDAGFYSPLTRSWELLFGALLAYFSFFKPKFLTFIKTRYANFIFSSHISDFCSFLGILFLALAFAIVRETHFPGVNALFPVIGTTLLIQAGPNAWFNKKILSSKVMVFIGLISYPLYLWHWPLLSFAWIIYLEEPSFLVSCFCIVMSFGLAWFTYRFIEPPLRWGKFSREKAIGLFLTLLVLGIVGYLIFAKVIYNYPFKKDPKMEELLAQKEVDVNRCLSKYPYWAKKGVFACALSLNDGKNTIALVGDSYADHFYIGLRASLGSEGIALFPSGLQVPYIDIQSAIRRKDTQQRFDIMQEALAIIQKDPIIRTVILAHSPNSIFANTKDLQDIHLTDKTKILENGIRRTLTMLEKSGKNVIIILPNPTLPFLPEKCANRPFTLQEKQCTYNRRQEENIVLYKEILFSVLKEFPKVKTVNLIDRFCDETTCYASYNENILYNDKGHLSSYGSLFAASPIIQEYKSMRSYTPN